MDAVQQFECPECHDRFTSTAGLAAHRRQKHHVEGQSRSSVARRGRGQAAKKKQRKTPAAPRRRTPTPSPQMVTKDATAETLLQQLLDEGEDWSAEQTQEFVNGVRMIRAGEQMVRAASAN